MNNQQYRYILQPYKGRNTRFFCPSCMDKEKTFVRYIDIINNNHINESVGKCNRETSCGYHLPPSEYFKNNNIPKDVFKPPFIALPPKPIKPSFIPVHLFDKSHNEHEHNFFIQFLLSKFGLEETKKAILKYCIGTSNHWQGGTVFWQIDINGNFRAGKIMQYNPTTGKRVKKPFNKISWVHTVENLVDFNLNQCLFGEHLLNRNTLPIALVESEKTAIIASITMPQFLWLATGNINNFSESKCNILKNKNVVVFPDLKAYPKWKEKANELQPITNFKVSNFLEENAHPNEINMGYDLADYLIQ